MLDPAFEGIIPEQFKDQPLTTLESPSNNINTNNENVENPE
jgi:hypothetical protein